jgi:hypothetical protein
MSSGGSSILASRCFTSVFQVLITIAWIKCVENIFWIYVECREVSKWETLFDINCFLSIITIVGPTNNKCRRFRFLFTRVTSSYGTWRLLELYLFWSQNTFAFNSGVHSELLWSLCTCFPLWKKSSSGVLKHRRDAVARKQSWRF